MDRAKGQVTIGTLIGIYSTIGASLLGAIYGAGIRTDSKLEARTESLRTMDVETTQRIATLEEAVLTLKGDTSEIKGDVKTILREIKN